MSRAYREKTPWNFPLIHPLLVGVHALVFVLTFTAYNPNFSAGALPITAYVPFVLLVIIDIIYAWSYRIVHIDATGIKMYITPIRWCNLHIPAQNIYSVQLISTSHLRQEAYALKIIDELRTSHAPYALRVQTTDDRVMLVGVESLQAIQALPTSHPLRPPQLDRTHSVQTP